MGYRNKTYVIFDGDNDMWAYAYMKGWKNSERIDFNFHDAHDIRPITARASEATVRTRLRERLGNMKQAIVLIDESTRYLYKFVRWELELCLDLEVPIVAVNLNGVRHMDTDLCPPILKGKYVVHVPFKLAIIRHALDSFPEEFFSRAPGSEGDRYYSDAIYRELGISD